MGFLSKVFAIVSGQVFSQNPSGKKEKSSKTKRGATSLRLESLESREMLAASPLAGGEFTGNYTGPTSVYMNLSQMTGYNVATLAIEVSQGSGSTFDPDLIVVKNTVTGATVTPQYRFDGTKSSVFIAEFPIGQYTIDVKADAGTGAFRCNVFIPGGPTNTGTGYSTIPTATTITQAQAAVEQAGTQWTAARATYYSNLLGSLYSDTMVATYPYLDANIDGAMTTADVSLIQANLNLKTITVSMTSAPATVTTPTVGSITTIPPVAENASLAQVNLLSLIQSQLTAAGRNPADFTITVNTAATYTAPGKSSVTVPTGVLSYNAATGFLDIKVGSEFSFLAAGTTADITFSYTVTDKNPNATPASIKTQTKDVKFSVTGVNSVPVVSSPTASIAVPATGSATVTFGATAGAAQVGVTDPDTGDDYSIATIGTRTVVAGGTYCVNANGTLSTNGAMLTSAHVGQITVVAGGKSFSFTPNRNNAEIAALTSSQTKDIVLSVAVKDKANYQSNQTNVTFTVTGTTGTNTAPTAAYTAAAVSVAANGTSASVSIGTGAANIRVTDPDSGDTHSLAAIGGVDVVAGIYRVSQNGTLSAKDAPLTSSHYGTLTVLAGGTSFTFAPNTTNTELAGLTTSQSRNLSLSVTVKDNGGLRSGAVTVTFQINGTVVSQNPTLGVTAGSYTVTEKTTATSTVATATVTNPTSGPYNFATTGNATVTANNFNFTGTYPTLVSGTDYTIAFTGGNDASKNITFALTSGTAKFDFIPAGGTLTLTIPITATKTGETSLTQNITVIITGANTAPVATAPTAQISVPVTGGTNPTISLGATAAANTIGVTDNDYNDTHTFATVGTDANVAAATTYYVSSTGTLSTSSSGNAHYGTIVFATGLRSFTFTPNALNTILSGLSTAEYRDLSISATVKDTAGLASNAVSISLRITGTKVVTTVTTPTIVGFAISNTTEDSANTTPNILSQITSQFGSRTTSDFAIAVNTATAKYTYNSVQYDIPAGFLAYNATSGVLTISPSEKFDFLPQGATANIVLTFTVTDTNLNATNKNPQTANITFAVTGINDNPVIIAPTAAIAFNFNTTQSVTVGSTLTTTQIQFTDKDTGDDVTFNAINGLTVATNGTYRVDSTGAVVGTSGAAVQATDLGTVRIGSGTNAKILIFTPNVDNTTLRALVTGTNHPFTLSKITLKDKTGGVSNEVDLKFAIKGTAPVPVPTLVATPATYTVTERNTTTATVATVKVDHAATGSTYAFDDAGNATVTTNDFGYTGTPPTLVSGTDYVIAFSGGDGVSKNITFALTSGTTKFDFIPAGKKLTLTIPITATKTGETPLTQNVTVIITGANNTPTVALPSNPFTVAANTTAGLTVSLSTAAGNNTIGVTDVDFGSGGTHFITVMGNLAAVLGATTYNVYKNGTAYTLGTTGTGDDIGTIAFSADRKSFVFKANADSPTVKALGHGVPLNFTLGNVTVSDGTATATASPLSFLITGINDAPTIIATVTSGTTTTTTSGTTPGLSQTLFDPKYTVTDDEGDSHAYSVTTLIAVGGGGAVLPSNPQTIATYLTIDPVTGIITLKPAAFQNLATTQSITLTLRVTVSDGALPATTGDLTITVNSGRFTTSPTAAININEDAASGATAAISISPAAAFTVTPTLAAATIAYTGGYNSTPIPGVPTTITPTAGQLAYNGTSKMLVFTPGTFFDFLPQGITATFTVPYTVTSNDPLTSNGFTQNCTLTIIVTGVNDAVSAVSTTLNGAATTTLDVDGDPDLDKTTFAPTYTITDIDKGDTYTYAVAASSFSATGGGGATVPNQTAATYLTVNATTGVITLKPDAFKDLKAGETVTLKFKVTVTDLGLTTATTPTDLTIVVTSGCPTVVSPSITTSENTPVTSSALSVTTVGGGASSVAFTQPTTPINVTYTGATGLPTTITLPANTIIYNDVARTFTFTPGTTFDYLPQDATATFAVGFTVTDIVTGLSTPASLTLTVNVTGVNDPPVATAPTGNIAATANVASSSVTLAAAAGARAIGVTDPDHVLANITLSKIGNLAVSTGTYIVSLTGTLSTGTLTNNDYGTVTVAADGKSFTFTPNNNNAIIKALAEGATMSVTLAVTVKDALNLESGSVNVVFAVTGINEVPVASYTAPQIAVPVTGGTSPTIAIGPTAGKDIVVTDLDAGDTHTFAAVGSNNLAAVLGETYYVMSDNTMTTTNPGNNSHYGTLVFASGVRSFTFTPNAANPTLAALLTTEFRDLSISATVKDFVGAPSNSVDISFKITGTKILTPTIANIPLDNPTEDTAAYEVDILTQIHNQLGSRAIGDFTITVTDLDSVKYTYNDEQFDLPAGFLSYDSDTGMLTVAPRNRFDFLPDGAEARVVFAFTVTDDNNNASNPAPQQRDITFIVTGVNDAPWMVAVTDTITVTAGDTIGKTVVVNGDIVGDVYILAVDDDTDWTEHLITMIGNQPVAPNTPYSVYYNGTTASLTGTGEVIGTIAFGGNTKSFTFKPDPASTTVKSLAADDELNFRLRVTVSDNEPVNEQTAFAWLDFTIIGINDPPVGTYTGGTITVAAGSVSTAVAIGTNITVQDPDHTTGFTFAQIGHLDLAAAGATLYVVYSAANLRYELQTTDPGALIHYGTVSVIGGTSFTFTPNKDNADIKALKAGDLLAPITLAVTVKDPLNLESTDSVNVVFIVKGISGPPVLTDHPIFTDEGLEDVDVTFGVASPNPVFTTTINEKDGKPDISIVFKQGSTTLTTGPLYTDLMAKIGGSFAVSLTETATAGTYTLDTTNFDFLPLGVSAVITIKYTATDTATSLFATGTQTITVYGENSKPTSVAISGSKTTFDVWTDNKPFTATASDYTVKVTDPDVGDTGNIYSLGTVTSTPADIGSYKAPALGDFLTIDPVTGLFTVWYGSLGEIPTGATLTYTFTIAATDKYGLPLPPVKTGETITLNITSSALVGVNTTLTIGATAVLEKVVTITDPSKTVQPTNSTWFTVHQPDMANAVVTGVMTNKAAIEKEVQEESWLRFTTSKVTGESGGTWKFTPSAGLVALVAPGETLTITVPVTTRNISTNTWGTATVTIVIYGKPTVGDVTMSTDENVVGTSTALSVTTGGTGFTVNIGATTGLPAGVTLGVNAITYDPATKTFKFTPGTAFDYLPQAATATFDVSFTVTDSTSGLESAPAKLTITVMGKNDPLTLTTDVRRDIYIISQLEDPQGHLTVKIVDGENGLLQTHDKDADTYTFELVTEDLKDEDGEDVATVTVEGFGDTNNALIAAEIEKALADILFLDEDGVSVAVDPDALLTAIQTVLGVSFTELSHDQTIALSFKINVKNVAGGDDVDSDIITLVIHNGDMVLYFNDITTNENTSDYTPLVVKVKDPADSTLKEVTGTVAFTDFANIEITYDGYTESEITAYKLPTTLGELLGEDFTDWDKFFKYDTVNKTFVFDPMGGGAGSLFAFLRKDTTASFTFNFTVIADHPFGGSTDVKMPSSITVHVTGVNNTPTASYTGTQVTVSANTASDSVAIGTVNGTIVVTDLDTGDTHTLASIGGQHLAAALGATLYVVSDGGTGHKVQTTNPGATAHYGTVSVIGGTSFTFTPNNSHPDIKKLADGASGTPPLTITLAVTVKDAADAQSNGVDITFEVKGINEIPVAAYVSGRISVPVTGGTNPTFAIGTDITVNDVDAGDSHTFAKIDGVTGPVAGTSYYVMSNDTMTATDPTDNSHYGTIVFATGVKSFTFTPNAANPTLAAMLTTAYHDLSILATVKDSTGAESNQVFVLLRIVGTNTGAVVTTPTIAGFTISNTTEDSVKTTPNILSQITSQLTGRNVSDFDIAVDFAGAKYTLNSVQYDVPVGFLSYNSGTGTLTIDPSKFNFLQQGAAANIVIAFTVTDTNTNATNKNPQTANITFTVTGVNDVPTITAGQTFTVSANQTITVKLPTTDTTQTGAIQVTDSDIGDIHTLVSLAGTAVVSATPYYVIKSGSVYALTLTDPGDTAHYGTLTYTAGSGIFFMPNKKNADISHLHSGAPLPFTLACVVNDGTANSAPVNITFEITFGFDLVETTPTYTPSIPADATYSDHDIDYVDIDLADFFTVTADSPNQQSLCEFTITAVTVTADGFDDDDVVAAAIATDAIEKILSIEPIDFFIISSNFNNALSVNLTQLAAVIGDAGVTGFSQLTGDQELTFTVTLSCTDGGMTKEITFTFTLTAAELTSLTIAETGLTLNATEGGDVTDELETTFTVTGGSGNYQVSDAMVDMANVTIYYNDGTDTTLLDKGNEYDAIMDELLSTMWNDLTFTAVATGTAGEYKVTLDASPFAFLPAGYSLKFDLEFIVEDTGADDDLDLLAVEMVDKTVPVRIACSVSGENSPITLVSIGTIELNSIPTDYTASVTGNEITIRLTGALSTQPVEFLVKYFLDTVDLSALIAPTRFNYTIVDTEIGEPTALVVGIDSTGNLTVNLGAVDFDSKGYAEYTFKIGVTDGGVTSYTETITVTITK